MSNLGDKLRFRNEDLILNVSKTVDRKVWDENKYEPFLDELCGNREYQKESIRTTLRYLLGGQYENLRQLAQENFQKNPNLEERYGSWSGLDKHLQLPDQLSCTIDLATGVGKSYVLYGLACILLSEGIVDRVLVLCPSTTIEFGLKGKFKQLSTNADLNDVLPDGSKFSPPRIINASDSLVEGSICIENYHAILEHVGSSIRQSLKGVGARTLVLNDEAHHVSNESASKVKRWKEFLLNSDYAFKYVVGVSGTCYIGDDYFSDVIYRYSLRQAIEERYVKTVDYIAEMPPTEQPDEKWQLIFNRHDEIRKKLNPRKLIPLSIVITPTIQDCKNVGEELKEFMLEKLSINSDLVDEKVLIVYNNAPDVSKLPFVDLPTSKVEWIVSVSMLNEGWDVKRVFQIIPHEKRAFNSKLLISQVLGRGLRIPENWNGPQPEVVVFNHDAWAIQIRHLVNEILEIEKRLSAHIQEDSPFHFMLHNIDYTLIPFSVKKPKTDEYNIFQKGYINLATENQSQDVNIEFEHAISGTQYRWQTKIQHKTYSVKEVAQAMFERMEESQDPDDSDPKMRTIYTDNYPLSRLEKIVERSIERAHATYITERMKQKFLQSLGTLRRKESENVRYKTKVKSYYQITTQQRQQDSVTAAELRNLKTYYYSDQTRESLRDEQIEFFDEVSEPGSGYKTVHISNSFDFKTPLNAVIADSENERKFIKTLLQSQNLAFYESWIKSTSTRFYEIDYAWKKGEHPKRGKFNPDIFIKMKDIIVVVEIKGEEELAEPSEENSKKNEYALNHFDRLNTYLEKEGNPLRYKFTFLTERSFGVFAQSLREGNIFTFQSELDVKLLEK